MKSFEEFAHNVNSNPYLKELAARYEENPDSLTVDELDTMCELYEDAYGDPFEDYDVGFDPYLGCYTDEC